MPAITRFLSRAGVLVFTLLAARAAFAGEPGQPAPREGDEIVVCGQFFHTGSKVVLWMDPGGYDAYRVERRYVPLDQAGWRASSAHLSSPSRYAMRKGSLSPAQVERFRGGGWDLPTLQSHIDQFVLHYDVEGCSRACFEVLHDRAGLSIHFMLDLDGTIYQTIDLKEEAWHATSSNDRSVGVEIANIGAYTNGEENPMDTWFKKGADGKETITIPAKFGANPEWTPHFQGHPARREPVTGEVQGKQLRQFDYTPQQYKALVKLTATLCTIFPKIKCDYPREADGKLMTHKLPGPELKNYQGVLGHYQIQTDKLDPGPALQWDYIIDNARAILKQPPVRNVLGETITAPPALIEDD
jgi:N-acetyl-anhydromuramyl-L-alanine amidase AmpD